MTSPTISRMIQVGRVLDEGKEAVREMVDATAGLHPLRAGSEILVRPSPFSFIPWCP